MTRRIDREDIRVGDVIEIRETLTVKSVDTSWSGRETELTYAEIPNRGFSVMDKAEIFLVSRGPALPTAFGSVVTVNPGTSNVGTWMLTTRGWISATETRFTADEFREFLDTYGFTFEAVK